MSDTISINKLPTRTWNRLKVNDAVIPWDENHTVLAGEDAFTAKAGETPAPLHLEVRGTDDAYSRRVIEIAAEPGSAVTFFEHCTAARPLSVELRLKAEENAKIRVVQFLHPSDGALLRHAITGACAGGGRIEILSILLGDGEIYADHQIDLNGDGSSLDAEIGYLGRRQQTVDINLTVNHFGKSTNSEIRAAGALMDQAKKVFRGTIDFKKGSADSVGSENETVLMLGEDVENKTVPIILCAEENVDGSHGATIGELDDETLFYFMSRGISKEQAEAVMARASIERPARLSGDAAFTEQVISALDAALGEKEEEA